jgi:hypothetical protein
MCDRRANGLNPEDVRSEDSIYFEQRYVLEAGWAHDECSEQFDGEDQIARIIFSTTRLRYPDGCGASIHG